MESNDIILFENEGGGLLSAPKSIQQHSISTPQDLILSDMDADNDLDIIVLSDFARISLYRNLGAGDFAEQEELDDNFEGFYIKEFASADFNGDGYKDLVDVSSNSLSNAGKVRLLLNDGTGGLNSAVTIADLPREFTEVESGDVDGDGSMDIVVASRAQGQLALYLNDGSGAFASAVTIESSPLMKIDALKLADIDENGTLDLIAKLGGDLVLYKNSAGVFGPSEVFPRPVNNVDFVDAADLDNDGAVDVVVSNNDRLYWSKNQGAGSFAPWQQLHNKGGRVQLFDMDSDGDLDILLAAKKVVFIENLGTGLFETSIELAGSSNPIDVVAGDLDADGSPDFLSTQGDILYWRPNQICQTPQSPAVTIISPTKARLDWEVNPVAFGYRVQGGIVGGTVYSRPKGSNLMNLNGLAPGATYAWQVRSGCPLDTSSYTQLQEFTMPTMRLLSQELIVGPNPAKHSLRIQGSFEQTESISCQVTDVLGRPLWSLAEQSAILDIDIVVTDWSAGVYFYTLYISGERLTGSFVVE